MGERVPQEHYSEPVWFDQENEAVATEEYYAKEHFGEQHFLGFLIVQKCHEAEKARRIESAEEILGLAAVAAQANDH